MLVHLVTRMLSLHSYLIYQLLNDCKCEFGNLEPHYFRLQWIEFPV